MSAGRPAVLAVTSALALLGSVSASGAAQEGANAEADTLTLPTIGGLSIEPTRGKLDSYPTVTSGGGCPKGTNTLTKVFGPGFQDDGENVIGNTETWEWGSPPAHRMVAPFTITLQEAAERQKIYRGLPIPTLQGVYQVVMTCRDPLPERTGDNYMWANYIGRIRITDQTYTALTTATDLPRNPRPKAGTEVMANTAPESALQAKRDEESLPEFVESLTAGTTAAQSRSGSDSTVALTASAGVLLAGLGLLYGLSRRGARGRRS